MLDAANSRLDRRILFLTHVGDPGGAEYKMIQLCGAVRSSAEVMLFQHGSLEATLRKLEIAVSVCPLPRNARAVRKEDGLFGLLKAIPSVLSVVGRVARKGRSADIVVCFSQKSFVLAAIAKPFMRRPILWFMNDILSPAHFSPMLIRLLAVLSRTSADHVVLNSQASLDAWKKAGGRNRGVSVVYPGTSEEQVAAQLQNREGIAHYRRKYSLGNKPLVGMFGRISRWKGQEVFLRAMAEVPDAEAVIVGGALFNEEDYESRMRALTSELGLDHRVTFVGHVDNVVTFMAACDVAVHCATAPEPFGLVIVEAMLAGTPVIASDGGGAQEIVARDVTGQLTPLNDHRALAAAIRRYLEDPDWSRQVAERANSRAREKFTGTAMTNGFLKVIEGL